jgi:hypothetical protein
VDPEHGIIYHNIRCYGCNGVQVILAKPDVKSNCDTPANLLHIDETAESVHRLCGCGMSGSGPTQRSVTLQEETTGHTKKDSSGRAVSQGSKMMKSDRYTVSTGYGETFDERRWKGKIYGATTNDRSVCTTTIVLLFAPYSKITSPSAGP